VTFLCAAFFIFYGGKGVASELHEHRFSSIDNQATGHLLGEPLATASANPAVFSPLRASRTEKAELPISVLHSEEVLHGFLIVRNLEGELLADGDVTQITRGDRVTSHLIFHFKDSSLFDETVVFSQRRIFRVISYRLLQKGPAFKHPVAFTMEGASGKVVIRYAEENGQEKTITEQLALPPDLANGMISTLLRNVRRNTPQITLSVVVATPKPRIVKLLISPESDDWFYIGNSAHKTIRYVVKVDLGGVAGFVAPIVGKQPPDARVWILEDEAPVFVRSEGPLSVGGPPYWVELASPVWKKGSLEDSPHQH
jgi:hypothetical protein